VSNAVEFNLADGSLRTGKLPDFQNARAKVLAVEAVSAGVGKSVLAANLAFELAALGHRVCLIDLDGLWPSQHRYFGLPQQQAAVLAGMRLLEQDRLDFASLGNLTVRLVAKGASIDFLSGYGLNLETSKLNWPLLETLLEFLSLNYSHIVLDTAAGFGTDWQVLVSKLASHRLLVLQPDSVSVSRFLDLEPRLINQDGAPVSLVINRLRSSVLGARPDWQVRQVLRERTQLNIQAMIPEDEILDEALQRGLPLRQLNGKSKALAAIVELAGRLA
jgi:cellulose biosynthesis protein BcsQ